MMTLPLASRRRHQLALLVTVTRERTIRLLLSPLVCSEAQFDDIVARVPRLLAPSVGSDTAAEHGVVAPMASTL